MLKPRYFQYNKNRSVKLDGGLNKRFTITDNTYDISCRYEGTTAAELKEGETTIITGYCPNVQVK